MPSFVGNVDSPVKLTPAESGAVSRRKAKIDPEVQKRDNESRANSSHRTDKSVQKTPA
jgi:hypothetical protein